MCIISFFSCKNYSRARHNLFDQLFMLDLVNIDTSLLLYGNDNLSLHTNNIFEIQVVFLCLNVYMSIYFNIICMTVTAFMEKIQ